MGDTAQTVSIDTLFDDSPDAIAKQYAMTESSNRLATVSNILGQKFGSSWKVILILMLLLLAIVILTLLLY